MFEQERAKIQQYCDAHREALVLQAICGLKCSECFPGRVADCWEDNQTENHVQEV